MKRLEYKYQKWVIGLKSRTPGYMVREELQRKVERKGGKASVRV